MNWNHLRDEAHHDAVAHGWWDNPPEFGTVIALIQSEASEALTEARNGHEPNETYFVCKATRLPCCHCQPGACSGRSLKPEGIPYEFADIIIRVLDACGQYGIDINAAIAEKMAFNKTRPYKHGKKF